MRKINQHTLQNHIELIIKLKGMTYGIAILNNNIDTTALHNELVNLECWLKELRETK
jgi:hypothetical protein